MGLLSLCSLCWERTLSRCFDGVACMLAQSCLVAPWNAARSAAAAHIPLHGSRWLHTTTRTGHEVLVGLGQPAFLPSQPPLVGGVKDSQVQPVLTAATPPVAGEAVMPLTKSDANSMRYSKPSYLRVRLLLDRRLSWRCCAGDYRASASGTGSRLCGVGTLFKDHYTDQGVSVSARR